MAFEGENSVESQSEGESKKQILLNAFDMSTVGHLSPGQWKVKLSIPELIYKLTDHDSRTHKIDQHQSII